VRLGARARATLGFPSLKLPEQRFLLGRGTNLPCGWALPQEFLEALARYRFDAVMIEPLLGGRQPVPAESR